MVIFMKRYFYINRGFAVYNYKDLVNLTNDFNNFDMFFKLDFIPNLVFGYHENSKTSIVLKGKEYILTRQFIDLDRNTEFLILSEQ